MELCARTVVHCPDEIRYPPYVISDLYLHDKKKIAKAV